MQKKKRVSQQQMARDLGLSQTLVSMVLNGRKQGVSGESYERIWAHARRSGYRPKGMATDLIPGGKRMQSVGIVMCTGLKFYSQCPFFGHVQHGLHEYVGEHGISLVFLGIENQLHVGKLKEMYHDGHHFRGLVVMGEVSRPFLHALKKIEPRIVAVSAEYPGLCHSVVANEEQAAELLVQHLIDLGHRKFAWLGGNVGMQRSQARLDAITRALRLHALSIETKHLVEKDGAERIEGRDAAQILLGSGNRSDLPTAWICYNGTMARGAINHLLQVGLHVPEDISVASFDLTRVSEEEKPTLTGAHSVPELIGRVAGEILLQTGGKTEGRYSETTLASQLVVRESTHQVSLRRKAPVRLFQFK